MLMNCIGNIALEGPETSKLFNQLGALDKTLDYFVWYYKDLYVLPVKSSPTSLVDFRRKYQDLIEAAILLLWNLTYGCDMHQLLPYIDALFYCCNQPLLAGSAYG